MRLFLAIELSEGVRRHLARVQEGLGAVAKGISFTRAENLHLTLKFLGEVADEAVAPLCKALAEVEVGELGLRAEGLACFPERGPIRIVGAGVGSAAGVVELHSRIEAACEGRNFPREGRAYRPHITLGRARRPLAPALRRRLADAAGASFPGPEMRSEGFVLIQSRLLDSGPEYSAIARFYKK